MKHLKLALVFAIVASIFLGCQSKSDPDPEPSQGKSTAASSHTLESNAIELNDAWLRPGSEGGNSAAYLNIHNGTHNADTLLSVETDAASKAEVHETFEEDEMMGMRPAGEQIIYPDSTIKLQPGGLHIMVMGLNRSLAEGDSVSLDLEFAVAGKREVIVPVTFSNSDM